MLDFVGSIHFVTTVTLARGAIFVEPEICRKILEAFEEHRAQHKLDCYGYVLMPDHLHALLVQTGEDETVPSAIGGFKRATSLHCKPSWYANMSLWREGYDDVPVPGSNTAKTKLEYMLANPLRAGLVTRPEDYLWSSAREYYLDEKGPMTLTKLTQ